MESVIEKDEADFRYEGNVESQDPCQKECKLGNERTQTPDNFKAHLYREYAIFVPGQGEPVSSHGLDAGG